MTRSSRQHPLANCGVAFGFFMQSLDTTIVNTALPSMAQSLGESPLHMHMVIVLCTDRGGDAARQRLAGRTKSGDAQLFSLPPSCCLLGSLFCALSGTLNELLLARALPGALAAR